MPFLIPVAASFAIGAIGAAEGGAVLGAALLAGAEIGAITLGAELLTMALTPTPKAPGQQLSVSLDPNQPRTVCFGQTATAGSLVTFQTWGDSNENIILVFAVADHQVDGLSGGWWMGEPIQINADTSVEQGKYKGTPYLWVRFLPGAWDDQIDPTLFANSGGRWTEGAWGRGVAKVIVQATFNANAHPQGLTGLFQFVWSIRGANLYDRRQDSSVGGDGPQRWDDKSTWAWSNNSGVVTENMLRGFREEDTTTPVGERTVDTFFGLNLTDADLPFAQNVAAMNHCDEPVAQLNNGAELSGAANSNTTTITLTSSVGLTTGATITIGVNSPDAEVNVVSVISGLTIQLQNKLANFHADGEEVSWVDSANNAPTIPRYTTNGNIGCDSDGQTALGNLLAAMGNARLLTGSGVDYVMLPGVAVTPLARPDGTAGTTILDTDLRLDGPHKFQQYQQLDQIPNAVYGRWSDPSQYFQAVQLPARLSLSDEAEDGGKKDVTFDVTYCTSSSQGQRCMEIYRRRERSQSQAQISVGPTYFGVEGGDWITWLSDRYGFNLAFEVQNARPILDDDSNFLGLTLDLQEIDSTVFDWDPDVDELALNNPAPLPSADPVAAEITGLTVTPSAMSDPVSGDQVPCLTFSFDDVLDIYCVAVQIEYQVAGNQGQNGAASEVFTVNVTIDPTAGFAGGTTTATVTNGVSSGLLYQARAIEVTVPDRPAEFTAWTNATGVTPGTYVALSTAVPWPGVMDTQGTRPADNATVGAQLSVNLLDEDDTILNSSDVVTSQGTSADTASVAGVESSSVIAQINTADANIIAVQDLINTANQQIANLLQTFGDTESAAASAAAAEAAETTTQQALVSAQTAASGAASSATGAAASAQSASGSATAANSALNQVQILQGDASTSASTASAASAAATTQAAAAQTSASVAAQIGTNALNPNSTFAIWGESLPAGVTDAGNAVGNTAQVAGQVSPSAMQLTTTAAMTTSGFTFPASGNPKIGTGWYVIEADIRLISGALTGAGVLVQGVNSSGASSGDVASVVFSISPDFGLSVNGGGSPGKPYKWRTLCQFSQVTTVGFSISGFNASPSIAGAGTAKVVAWDRLDLRPADSSEVQGASALTIASSASATLTSFQTAQTSQNSAFATEISNNTSTLNGLSSTVSQNASTQETQNSTFATQVATLQAQVSINPNLLPNGGFANGLAGWGVAGLGAVVSDNPTFGRIAGIPSLPTSTASFFQSINVPVASFTTYTASGNVEVITASAALPSWLGIAFVDANGNSLGGVDSAQKVQVLTANGPNNVLTFTTPANCTSVIYFAIGNFAGGPATGFLGRAKIEIGALYTGWSDDASINSIAASVATNSSAIATLTGQLYATWSVVALAGGIQTGIQLLSASGPETISAIIMQAENVIIKSASQGSGVAPFAFNSSTGTLVLQNVIITNAVIGTAAIGTLNLAASSVSNITTFTGSPSVVLPNGGNANVATGLNLTTHGGQLYIYCQMTFTNTSTNTNYACTIGFNAGSAGNLATILLALSEQHGFFPDTEANFSGLLTNAPSATTSCSITGGVDNGGGDTIEVVAFFVAIMEFKR